MQKIRFLKEMPGRSVGEVIEERYLKGGYSFSGVLCSVEFLIEEGFVEWVREYKCKLCNDRGKLPCSVCVEAGTSCATGSKCSCQEKTLVRNFRDFYDDMPGDYYKDLAKIAEKHYTENPEEIGCVRKDELIRAENRVVDMKEKVLKVVESVTKEQGVYDGWTCKAIRTALKENL